MKRSSVRKLLAAGPLVLTAAFIVPASADPVIVTSTVGFTDPAPGQVDCNDSFVTPSGSNACGQYAWRTGDDPQSSLTWENPGSQNFDEGDFFDVNMVLQENNVIPVEFGWDSGIIVDVEVAPQADPGNVQLLTLNLPINFVETLNSEPCPAPNPNGTVCDDIYTFGDPTGSFLFDFGTFTAEFDVSLVPGAGVFCNDLGAAQQCFTEEDAPGFTDVAIRVLYADQVVVDNPEPGTLALLGLGLAGLGFSARRKRS